MLRNSTLQMCADGLVAAVLLCVSVFHCLADESYPAVSIFVRNEARIADAELAWTKQGVSKIFRGVGLSIKWVDYPVSQSMVCEEGLCARIPRPTEILLRIIPRSAAQSRYVMHFGYGYVQTAETEFGYYAVVFTDGPQRLSRVREHRDQILALLIAHEAGHLLLAAPEHSRMGIMHFPWSEKELSDASRYWLTFTPEQAKTMREQVRSRIRAQQAAEPVATLAQK